MDVKAGMGGTALQATTIETVPVAGRTVFCGDGVDTGSIEQCIDCQRLTRRHREDVLCWFRNIYGEPYAAVGCYDARFKMWDVDSEYAEPGSVTHWMHLPVKPED